MTRTSPPRPLLLAILDGWGHNPDAEQNAIAQAHTPHWDALLRDYPHGLINASELHVGLPSGQMGNSEVGHMNIGAGRVVMQDLPRIDAAIADGSLAQHPALGQLIAALKASGGVCHLLGLLSPGGVHAHQLHIVALAKILDAAGVPVRMHAFLDGRDTPPKSALDYLGEVERALAGSRNVQFATVSGRYYAMDRDKRWERVEKAYHALVDGHAEVQAKNAEAAIQQSYANNVTDEFVLPTIVGNYTGMRDGDGLLMANFRADRARQLLTALLDPAFDGFARPRTPRFAAALGMVEYSEALHRFLPALFPPEALSDILGEVVSRAGLTQLRIAETEKYAHVTFFFNGGREEVFPGEERILVPSPKVATYDLQPEMSAHLLTDQLVTAIQSRKFDVIVVNYANTDMVGHTGDLAAAIKAVEAVDQSLGRLRTALAEVGGGMMVTADHGNAECLYDPETKQAHTAHTLNLVPVVLALPELRGKTLTLREGKLADIAPTLLTVLGLPQPAAMTGQSLLVP